jgi:hypothetical protein
MPYEKSEKYFTSSSRFHCANEHFIVNGPAFRPARIPLRNMLTDGTFSPAAAGQAYFPYTLCGAARSSFFILRNARVTRANLSGS